MEGVVAMGELGAREHPLVGEVVAGNPVELIATGLGGKRHLDGTGGAIIDSKSVDLNARFLNRVGIGREVQNPLPNSARHVEPVHNKQVGHRALAVGTDIDLCFGGVVVHPGTRRATSSGDAPAHRSHSGNAGSHDHQADHATPGHREVRECSRPERHLVAGLCRVQDRRRPGYFDSLGYCLYREGNRHVQSLVRF